MADESHDCSEIAKIPGSSASTSSSSDGSIINNNRGKQGDVVTGVRGDIIKDVGGDVIKDVGGDVIKDVGGDVIKNVNVGGDLIKDVHVGGDFIYGEKKILPPRFVVLTAKNGKCLRLTKNDDGNFLAGFLKFDGSGREVASPQAKFELETAKSESGIELVHIRCCHNNKYLVRSDTTCWIVAAADKPEENKSKISCTLFELERVNICGELKFRFRHSQRRMYACFSRVWSHGIQFLGLSVDTDEADAYTVDAWETLVKQMNKAVQQLPKFVALKGTCLTNNNKYLSLTTKNDPPLQAGFLQFKEKEVASPLTKFELEMAKSEKGLVHIRCCNNNKYLVRSDTCTHCYYNNTEICDHCCNNTYCIAAAADKPEEDEYKVSCTLFEPEPYDESRLVFRFRHIHLGLGKYACMCTDSSCNGGLHGASNAPERDGYDVYKVVDLDGLG